MYAIDDKDRVVARPEIPQSDMGAPAPRIISTEQRCVLSYECRQSDFAQRETLYAIGIFAGSFYFGGPNDEALSGHPLHSRGLRAYGSFEVLDSSWVRLMEYRNRVHRSHQAELFWQLKHFIITFHDSLFECVTTDLRFETWNGDPATLTEEMRKRGRI